MKAFVIDKDHMKYKDVQAPTLKEDEVLIKVKACGICGSDLPRAFEEGAHYYPIILGHEFSGEIIEIGKGVDHFKIGDSVIVAPLLPCGKCYYCKVSKPAMCKQYDFLGSRCEGAMAEYVAVKAENVIHMPKGLDYKQAAMVEPLTVALHGVERINIKSDTVAVVFGAGTIGLLALQCLKVLGTSKVYVVDVVPKKLELAKLLGADEVIDATQIHPVDYMQKHGKPTVAIETAGNPITQTQCIEAVDQLGQVVYIGTAHKHVNFEPKTFEKILRGELRVTGSWMSYSTPYPGHEWKVALDLMKDKKVKVEPLITHVFHLKDAKKAFEVMKETKVFSIKVMLTL